MRWLLLIFLASYPHTQTHAQSLSEQKAWLPNRNIDVKSYDFTLKIDDIKSKTLSAHLEIELISLKKISAIELHCECKTSIHIKSIFSDGKPLTFYIGKGEGNEHGLSGAFLKIKKEVQRGENVKLSLDYSIQVLRDGKGFYASTFYGESILNTINWPYFARYWLPSNDHPEDPATFKSTISVPRGFHALANGLLQKQEGATYFWDLQTPISTYGLNIVISKLQKTGSNICFDIMTLESNTTCERAGMKIPFEFYYPAKFEDLELYLKQLEKAKAALVYFSKVLSPYKFPKLGFVTAPHPFNMESPTLITLVDEDAAVHEVVHQWWGNSVRIPHWGELWISEGFTTYLTGFYDEVMTGENTACEQNNGKLNNPIETDPLDVFDNTPYCKGASALGGLRKAIADALGLPYDKKEMRDLFESFFVQVYGNFQNRAMSTDDFISFTRFQVPILVKDYNVSPDEIARALDQWEKDWF
ncbi:MAG: M1 family aminopeptidase [Pseudobdellovibrionaceae bacterium]